MSRWDLIIILVLATLASFSAALESHESPPPPCYLDTVLSIKRGETIGSQIDQYCLDNSIEESRCQSWKEFIAPIFTLGDILLPVRVVSHKTNDSNVLAASLDVPFYVDGSRKLPSEVLALNGIEISREDSKTWCAKDREELKNLNYGPLESSYEKAQSFCTSHYLSPTMCQQLQSQAEAFLNESRPVELTSEHQYVPFKTASMRISVKHDTHIPVGISPELELLVNSFDDVDEISQPVCARLNASEAECEAVRTDFRSQRFPPCPKHSPEIRYRIKSSSTSVLVSPWAKTPIHHQQITEFCSTENLPQSSCDLLKLQVSTLFHANEMKLPVRIINPTTTQCEAADESSDSIQAMTLVFNGYTRAASELFYELMLQYRGGDPWNEFFPQSTVDFMNRRKLFANSRLAVNKLLYARLSNKKSKPQVMRNTFGKSPLTMLTNGNLLITANHKLLHDEEQILYLISKQLLPKEFMKYAHQLRKLRLSDEVPDDGEMAAMTSKHYSMVGEVYNTALYVPHGPAPGTIPHAVNPSLDFEKFTDDYFDSTVGVAVIDDFLTPTALEAVYNLCLESTVFNDVKPGYLGAYFQEGLSTDLFAQIEDELRQYLPEIMKNHTIQNLWAYKYDGDLGGIRVHADDAAVNFNFWVTPDSANLNNKTGGLEVYTRSARLEDGVEKWNSHEAAAQHEMMKYLQGSTKISIPYRQNRVVMFNSNLFHATAPLHFKRGYTNRRINLTMLFGKRQEHVSRSRRKKS